MRLLGFLLLPLGVIAAVFVRLPGWARAVVVCALALALLLWT